MGLLRSHEYEIYLLMFFNCVFYVLMFTFRNMLSNCIYVFCGVDVCKIQSLKHGQFCTYYSVKEMS